MEKDHRLQNGSKVLRWCLDKILPWAVIALFGFLIEIHAWRREAKIQLEDLPSIAWTTETTAELKHQREHIEELKTTIAKMKNKMDTAVGTGPAGHMTHREHRLLHE